MSLSYINTSLIPTLCKVAGIPRTDERGTITSHRARATLATLLYNAPEGLSLFELMHWLGHTNPLSLTLLNLKTQSKEPSSSDFAEG